MKKLTILTTIFLLSVTSHSFAVSKKADMGPVGSCMRECVQTVNPSDNDVYASDVSVDEFTLDCVNYCNPNLKEGYCSPEEDECCNVMYQDTDPDCSQTFSYTFSGQIDFVSPPISDDNIYTFYVGEKYQGYVEYKHTELCGEQCIDILRLEIDFENSEDITLENFLNLDDDPYLSMSHWQFLQAQAYGEGTYLGKGLMWIAIMEDKFNNTRDFSMAFDDWPNYVHFTIDSGTLLEYPKYSYWPNLPPGSQCTADSQCQSGTCKPIVNTCSYQ